VQKTTPGRCTSIETTPTLSRRAELGAFLRTRRDALDPEAAGIGDGARRHVPGLRREEVASLAGISTTWYTWIEQGREINMSPDVLDAVGRALNLQPHEMVYIKRLASDEPSERYDPAPEVPEALRTLVESHQAAPAYISTSRFDLLAWNTYMHEMFHYRRNSEPLQRNVIWRMFFDPTRRDTYVDWHGTARRSVASFRSNYTRYRGEPAFEELLDELLKSPEFSEYWSRWEISELGLPPFRVRTPATGLCELSTIQATIDISPGVYLVLFNCTKLDG
jgi:transcriptional regulator with XRE-family HTH domain